MESKANKNFTSNSKLAVKEWAEELELFSRQIVIYFQPVEKKAKTTSSQPEWLFFVEIVEAIGFWPVYRQFKFHFGCCRGFNLCESSEHGIKFDRCFSYWTHTYTKRYWPTLCWKYIYIYIPIERQDKGEVIKIIIIKYFDFIARRF